MPTNQNQKEIIKYIIEYLEQLKKKAQKVTLQKILYYLSIKDVQISYHFEPYTYGPFSKELASDIDDLTFWDEIKITGSKIEKGKKFKIQLDLETKDEIKQYIDEFIDLVENTGFANIELYTTLIYNIRALEDIGKEIDFQTVLDEFKAWKGEKFLTDDIKNAYDRIFPIVVAA